MLPASPAFQSAAINGATLTITFDETLDPNSLPLAGFFGVSATPPGGSARNIFGTGIVTLSGATATVPLAVAVAGGATVEVRYATVGSSPPLQDAAGNEVAPFSGQAVTNNTPDTTPPAFQSAAVNAQTLTVTFNETLDPNSLPAPGRFAVTATPPGGSARNIFGTGGAQETAPTTEVRGEAREVPPDDTEPEALAVLMYMAATVGNNEALSELISRRADVNWLGPGNTSALIAAILGDGDSDTVELLINAGADVNTSFQGLSRSLLIFARGGCAVILCDSLGGRLLLGFEITEG